MFHCEPIFFTLPSSIFIFNNRQFSYLIHFTGRYIWTFVATLVREDCVQSTTSSGSCSTKHLVSQFRPRVTVTCDREIVSKCLLSDYCLMAIPPRCR